MPQPLACPSGRPPRVTPRLTPRPVARQARHRHGSPSSSKTSYSTSSYLLLSQQSLHTSRVASTLAATTSTTLRLHSPDRQHAEKEEGEYPACFVLAARTASALCRCLVVESSGHGRQITRMIADTRIGADVPAEQKAGWGAFIKSLAHMTGDLSSMTAPPCTSAVAPPSRERACVPMLTGRSHSVACVADRVPGVLVRAPRPVCRHFAGRERAGPDGARPQVVHRYPARAVHCAYPSPERRTHRSCIQTRNEKMGSEKKVSWLALP